MRASAGHFDHAADHAPVLELERHLDRGGARTFLLERNAYFAGGRVDVYEIYHRPLY